VESFYGLELKTLFSEVGTSCRLGGPRWVDKTMSISNEIKKDNTHIQATMG